MRLLATAAAAAASLAGAAPSGLRDGASTAASAPADPKDILKRTITQAYSQSYSGDFWRYQYGSSIMMEAGYLASARVPGFNVTRAVDRRLASFITNSSYPGYKILNNVSMPFDNAVGDGLGLFPIAFLARMDFYGLDESSPEWAIATRTAQQYVDTWPYHLPDGTYSRMGGWPGEPTGKPTFVWSDDAYMGIGLIVRLVKHGYFNSTVYQDIAADIQTLYATHLRDSATGLYRHGYDAATGTQSCCAWGRANGWQSMSHVEALSILPPSHPKYPAALGAFRAHAAALAAVQDPADGRWHQVLDHPETYLETSVTAMNVFAFATGVLSGWLDKATFDPVIRRGWAGLAAQVAPDGSVAGICQGTGVLTSVAEYAARPTAYNVSSPGLGAVFRAALAYDSYVTAYGPGEGAAA